MSLVPYKDNPNDPAVVQPLRDDRDADPEQFEDEPGSEYNDDTPTTTSGMNNGPSSEEGTPIRSSSDRPKKSKSGKKKKGKGKGSSSRRTDAGMVPYTGPGVGGNGAGDKGTDEPRRHKYSTADKKEPRPWKKYCWIFLMFVLLILFMIAISMLMQHFFFSDKSDNTDMSEFVRNPNSTFPLEKRDVDQACSRGTLAADDGATCKNVCLPVYYECCDPFNEFVLYDNYQTVPPSNNTESDNDDKFGGLSANDYVNRNNGTFTPTSSPAPTYEQLEVNKTTKGNVTSTPTQSPSTSASPTRTVVRQRIRRFLYGDDDNNNNEPVERNQKEQAVVDITDDRLLEEIPIPITVAPVWWNDHKAKMDEHIKSRENLTCTLDNELQGCMRYAKCQAISGKVDPAPATLSDLCSHENLIKDPQGCRSVCYDAACCYANDHTNCVAKEFAMCLDYAPCQNLRFIDQPEATDIIPAAPRTLDIDCFYQQQGCLDNCSVAECCSDRSTSCFSRNFVSCLTYAPCNNITRTHIHVPEQFNTVEAPPNEILDACDPDNGELVLDPKVKSCRELCETSACCRSKDPDVNCFDDDPLGCLVWDTQCTVNNEDFDFGFN